MSYTALPNLENVPEYSRPRFLTLEEIDDILNSLPEPKSADPFTREIVRNQQKEKLREELLDVEISPLAIPFLKFEIQKSYYQSIIDAGESVGVNSASSISAAVTQATLNSFHFSGSKTAAGSGISSVGNALYIPAIQNNTISIIHFNDRTLLPIDIATEFIPKITPTTIGDLIGANLKNFYVVDIEDEKQKQDFITKNPWLPFAMKIQEKKLGNSSSILVLEIDVSRMIKSQASMSDLAKILQEESHRKNRKDKKEKPNLVDIIYSSLEDGKIIVIPKLQEKDFFEEMDFYGNAFLKNLEEIRVQGIKGYGEAYVTSSSLDLAILSSKKIEYGTPRAQLYSIFEDERDYWEISLNRSQMHFEDIKIEDVQRMLLIAFPDSEFLETEETRAEFLIFSTPKDSGDPLEMIKPIIAKAKKDYSLELGKISQKIAKAKNAREKFSLLREYENFPYPDILLCSQYYYIEAQGDNLPELFKIYGIRKRATYCNNTNVIFKNLGIANTWSFYARNLYKIITSSGNSIHAANILILTDCVTSVGKPYGVRFAGTLSRQGSVQHVTNASIEKAMKIFATAAAFGSIESTKGPSAAVAMGTLMTNGDGYNQVGYSYTDLNGQAKIVYDEQIYTAHEDDTKTAEIRKTMKRERQRVYLKEVPQGKVEEPIEVLNLITAPIGALPTAEDVFKQLEMEVQKEGFVSKGLVFNIPQDPNIVWGFDERNLDKLQKMPILESKTFALRDFDRMFRNPPPLVATTQRDVENFINRKIEM